MLRYDKIAGDWVDLDAWYARRSFEPARGVQIIPDAKPFKSPLEGHKVIDGRAALREELKRNNCRIVEKSEFRHTHDRKGLAYSDPSPRPRFAVQGEMNGRGR